MDREIDFRDDDGNSEALTGWESDAETLSGGENNFSTEDQEIGVNSNGGMLSDETLWATIEYGGLNFIVLNL